MNMRMPVYDTVVKCTSKQQACIVGFFGTTTINNTEFVG